MKKRKNDSSLGLGKNSDSRGRESENHQMLWLSYQKALKKLSPIEAKVLDLIEQGLTSGEIADKLKKAEGTVRSHRNNICKKIGITGSNGILKWLWWAKHRKNNS